VSYFLDHLWLIPVFPLCGAALMLLLGRKIDPQSQASGNHARPGHALVNLICPGMALAAFVFAAGAVWQLARQLPKSHETIAFTWIAGMPFHLANGRLGSFSIDWGYLLDPLSGVMILVVTGIGFLIHVYSTGYMAHDGGYYRFFGSLNLFIFFMLMLVLANNYGLMFVGWEGVGLCSYLLIGFYFDRNSAGAAGMKAFIVNRVGDAGFVLGILLMLSVVGTLRFTEVERVLHTAGFTRETGFGVLSVMALLLFVGATGKSAQFPLYVWLPDAMEGPTPVSALIHAATMVTAGVYMVARSSALFELAPAASGIVAIVGAFTAILAASIALVQNDIKRVLAYSTVSQLGYMFLAAGVGAYWVSIFHLFTHAFFKALLFLGAGSVIHAVGGEQDMRRMGGLKDRIPVTHWTMLIGAVAIAGIPGFAGFFSKDEILWQAFSSRMGSPLLYAVGLATAAMTAFYMWRLMSLTFYGQSRMAPEKAAHIHESPPSMTAPLIVLAAGSVFAGWLGTPKSWSLPLFFRGFESWLAPLFPEPAETRPQGSIELLLMVLSVVLAVAAIVLARYLYHHRPEFPARIRERCGPLHRCLSNKWYVDELYDIAIVNGLAKGGGRLLSAVDRAVVDGGVNGAGRLTRWSGVLSGWWDTWVIDGAVRLSSFLVKITSYPVCLLQTGRLQAYALFVVAGALVLFGFYVVR
jgi:NADH-quinone oxidoreductase subunit L